MGVFVHSVEHLPTLLPSLWSCIGTETLIVSHPLVNASGVKLQKVPNCGKSSFVGPFNILDFCLSLYTQSRRPADPFSCWIKVKCCASVPDISFFQSNPKETCNYAALAERPIQPRTSDSRTNKYCVMQRERGAVHILKVTVTSSVIISMKKLYFKECASRLDLDAHANQPDTCCNTKPVCHRHCVSFQNSHHFPGSEHDSCSKHS